MPKQFTVLLGTGSLAKSKSQVGGVLVAVKILLSVGSIISHKKDCLKCVIIRKNSKSQVGESFGGWEKSCFLLEAFFRTKKTASKCVIIQKNSKSQVGWSFGGWEYLAICWKHYFAQKKLPQNVWSSEKILSPRQEEVLVAGNILLSFWSIISHKKDWLKMCDHPKKF